MSSGSALLDPLHRITPDDRGPILIVVAYSLVFVTILILLVRFGTAYHQGLRFRVDDATYLLATVFATASSICFHQAVEGGMGRHISTLDATQRNRYYKNLYAAEIMGIAAMTAAKISVVLLSDRIAPQKSRPFYIMIAVVGVWAVFSIFAVSFQCGLSNSWRYIPSECSSGANVIYPIIIGNILTDILVTVWILPTLWKLLMEVTKRAKVVALFGCRLIVCAAALGQLITMARHMKDEDQTWFRLRSVVWEICTIYLSVILATVPRTNQFLSSMHTAHVTTQLTDYELAQGASHEPPMTQRQRSTSEENGDNIAPLVRSNSQAQSAQSQEPLVNMSLKLTPGWGKDNITTTVSGNDQRKGKGKKRSTDEWKRFMGLSTTSSKSQTNTQSSVGAPPPLKRMTKEERLQMLRTRKVTQKVEAASPEEEGSKK